MNIKERTGEKIKRIRLEKGLTQKELAKLSNMYESQIRKYENGQANPKIETLQKIATAMDIPVSLLKSDFDFHIEELEEKIKLYFTSVESQIKIENQLIYNYRKLNDKGQKKAFEHIKMLTKIPDFQKLEEDAEKVKNSLSSLHSIEAEKQKIIKKGGIVNLEEQNPSKKDED